MRSLGDSLSCFVMTKVAGKGSTKDQANLLTKTCQKKDPQNPCKQAGEGEIFAVTVGQNPYKLPLNQELALFTERPDESANNVIDYQCRFENNR